MPSYVELELDEKRVEEKPYNYSGIVEFAVEKHFEFESYKLDYDSPRNPWIIGRGNLSNLTFGGSARGFVIFRSPLDSFLHISSLGGGGIPFIYANLQALLILGRAEKPSVIFLKRKEGKLEWKIEELSKDELFSFYTKENHVFSLEKKLYEKAKEFFEGLYFRVFVVGPGSIYSKFGSLFSSISEKEVGNVFDVAGRGGSGSSLFAHNIVGMVIGGDGKEDEGLVEKMKMVFREELGNNYMQKMIEGTKKYREFGTFKANYSSYKNKLPLFNWNFFFLEEEEKSRIWEKFVDSKLLKDYTFETKTCMEKCVAACKKIERYDNHKREKVDYEPFHALGALLGIFDRERIAKLVWLADSLGFDAIYLGFFIAGILEALESGKISLKELGIEAETKELPCLNPKVYKEDKERVNFEIAQKIIKKIANGEFGFKSIKEFIEKFDVKEEMLFLDFGEKGDLTPNYYYTLGLVAPILMHGKYFSDYKPRYLPPEEYAKVCYERLIKELAIANAGYCRFHREYLEPILDKVMEKVLGIQNYSERIKEIAKKLLEYKRKVGIRQEEPKGKLLKIVNRFLEENNANIPANEYFKRFERKYLSFFENSAE